MSFAENIVYLRQHYDVTQEGLAEKLGVSRQTVSKWEAGTNYPEMEKLLVLCDLFHVNMDELLRGVVSVAKEGDTERYDRHMNRYNASIVGGIVAIIAGSGTVALSDALNLPDNLGGAVFMAFVVVGVILFIMGGLNHHEFKRSNPGIEPRYDDAALSRFSRRFPQMIAGGVGLILLDVIFLTALSSDDNSLALVRGIPVVDLLIAPFMLVMALAIGLLIWAGMQKSKYDLSELTYVARRSDLGANLPPNAVVKSPEQLRAERLTGAACGVIMLLATIVFLVWGLVPLFNQVGGWSGIDGLALKDAIRSGRGGFAVSWIAFVVGGILCGIVYLVGSVLSKSNEDWIAEARQENAWVKYPQPKPPEAGPGSPGPGAGPGSRSPEEQDGAASERPRT